MTPAAHFPKDERGKRFCQFFTHRHNFIEAQANGNDRPNWKTITDYPIEHRNLWHRFQDPQTLIGVSFGSSTNYALLDIDINSPYHPQTNEAALRELLGAYEDVGINKYIAIQSSWSQGIHVYFPLPKFVPTYRLAVLLRLTAIKSGFRVKDGQLEIFPNTKSYNPKKPTNYKAHRLPLQPQSGSFMLDDDLMPESHSIEKFLDLADIAAQGQDIELIEGAAQLAYQTRKSRSDRPLSIKAEEFQRDLLEQLKDGWSDFGQTNDLLRVIGTHGRIFEKRDGQPLSLAELTEYIAATAQQLPNYRKYCRHQHHINQRASDWARCVAKFYYPYGSEPNREGRFPASASKIPKENLVNAERSLRAIERLKTAYDHLLTTLSTLPVKIEQLKSLIIETSQKLFGIRPSDRTLNKHRSIWHPQHQDREEIQKSDTVAHASPIAEPTPTNLEENYRLVSSQDLTCQGRETARHPSEPPIKTPIPPPNVLQTETRPQAAPVNHKKSGPTPPDVVRQNQNQVTERKRIPDSQSGLDAPPPHYMKVSSEDLNPEAGTRIDAYPQWNEGSDLTERTPDSTHPNFNTSSSQLNNSHRTLDSTEIHLNSDFQVDKNQYLDKPRLCVNNAGNQPKTYKNKLSDWLHPQWHRWILCLISGMLCSQSDEGKPKPTCLSPIASLDREKNPTHARPLEPVSEAIEEIAPISQAALPSSNGIARTAQSEALQMDFLTWYSQVPKTDDGILDVPHRYLPTDRNKEPLVRIGRPDPWLKIPYTLLCWRQAMAEFPLS